METKGPIINIFTVCDKSYEDFIPIFVLSNLTYVPQSIVEICVLDKERVLGFESTKCVLRMFPGRVFIRQADFVRADKARFTTNVVNKTDYVYITDVDIITMKGNIVETHLALMKKTGLPYSNGVRPQTKRMTGVHFTTYDAYYPIKKSDFHLILSDEEILYRIIRSRNLKLPSEFIRPLFGIHMSPHRYAIDATGWSIKGYKPEWNEFKETEEYKKLFPFLSNRIKNYLLIVNYVATS